MDQLIPATGQRLRESVIRVVSFTDCAVVAASVAYSVYLRYKFKTGRIRSTNTIVLVTAIFVCSAAQIADYTCETYHDETLESFGNLFKNKTCHKHMQKCPLAPQCCGECVPTASGLHLCGAAADRRNYTDLRLSGAAIDCLPERFPYVTELRCCADLFCAPSNEFPGNQLMGTCQALPNTDFQHRKYELNVVTFISAVAALTANMAGGIATLAFSSHFLLEDYLVLAPKIECKLSATTIQHLVIFSLVPATILGDAAGSLLVRVKDI